MRALLGGVTIAVILTVVGCAAPLPGPTDATPETVTPPDPAPPRASGTGTLAYVGGDGNVWTTVPGEGRTRQVTRDATAPPEGQGRSYHRVAWLRDGSLAFASVDRSGDDASSEIFLQRAPDEPPRRIARNDEHFVIYLYGSPAPYSRESGCPSLAYLIEEENGVGLHLVMTREGASPQDLLLAVGRPFYFSWSPDGERILWHTGGALRDNPVAEIGLYDIVEDRRRVLPFAPGTFPAPAWSGQGDRWLGVTASNGANRFQHIGSDEVATLMTSAGEEIVFVPAPDGRRVAYAVRDPDNPVAYGPIHVVDLRTGRTSQSTDDAFGVLGFFWSPDGRRIAYLSRLDLPDSVWMQWRVFDPGSGRDRGFAAFHPSPLMRFMVHSFNQYAQSHRFWSPDGRTLVYADRDDGGADRVWLVDTEAEKGADPILVDEGSIGVWSWR
jgi:hypothetical protein